MSVDFSRSGSKFLLFLFFISVLHARAHVPTVDPTYEPTNEPTIAATTTTTLHINWDETSYVAPEKCFWSTGVLKQSQSPYWSFTLGNWTDDDGWVPSYNQELQMKRKCCELCALDAKCIHATLNTKSRICSFTTLSIDDLEVTHGERFNYYALGCRTRTKAADKESSCDYLCEVNHGQYEGQHDDGVPYKIHYMLEAYKTPITSCQCSVCYACGNGIEFLRSTENTSAAIFISSIILALFIPCMYGPPIALLMHLLIRTKTQNRLVQVINLPAGEYKSLLGKINFPTELCIMSGIIIMRSIFIIFVLAHAKIQQSHFINGIVNMPHNNLLFTNIYRFAELDACLHLYFVLLLGGKFYQEYRKNKHEPTRYSFMVSTLGLCFNLYCVLHLAWMRQVELALSFKCNILIVFAVAIRYVYYANERPCSGYPGHWHCHGVPTNHSCEATWNGDKCERFDDEHNCFLAFLHACVAPFVAILTPRYSCNEELTDSQKRKRLLSIPMLAAVVVRLYCLGGLYLVWTCFIPQDHSMAWKQSYLYAAFVVISLGCGLVYWCMMKYEGGNMNPLDYLWCQEDRKYWTRSLWILLWWTSIQIFCQLAVGYALATVEDDSGGANWFRFASFLFYTLMFALAIGIATTRSRVAVYTAVVMKGEAAFTIGTLLNDERVFGVTFTNGMFLLGLILTTSAMLIYWIFFGSREAIRLVQELPENSIVKRKVTEYGPRKRPNQSFREDGKVQEIIDRARYSGPIEIVQKGPHGFKNVLVEDGSATTPSIGTLELDAPPESPLGNVSIDIVDGVGGSTIKSDPTKQPVESDELPAVPMTMKISSPDSVDSHTSSGAMKKPETPNSDCSTYREMRILETVPLHEQSALKAQSSNDTVRSDPDYFSDPRGENIHEWMWILLLLDYHTFGQLAIIWIIIGFVGICYGMGWFYTRVMSGESPCESAITAATGFLYGNSIGRTKRIALYVGVGTISCVTYFFLICLLDFPLDERETFNIVCIPPLTFFGLSVPFSWACSPVVSYFTGEDSEDENAATDQECHSHGGDNHKSHNHNHDTCSHENVMGVMLSKFKKGGKSHSKKYQPVPTSSPPTSHTNFLSVSNN